MMKKWMLLAVVLVLCLGVGTALAVPEYVEVDGEKLIITVPEEGQKKKVHS